jgi:Asp-tRNA(Asn)/Glu-tRNA(Gln) amidotransferase A subunit family amidase
MGRRGRARSGRGGFGAAPGDRPPSERTIGPGDVLCLPTSPRIAPFRNTATDRIEIEYRNQAMCLLCIAGLGGLPQVSLPLAELDGMPLGLSLVGRRDTDEALLALTSAISQPDALADDRSAVRWPHAAARRPS